MSKQGNIIIDRIRDNGTETLGRGRALINGSQKLEFVSLEPSWVLNENNISCIPCGTYQAAKRQSSKFGDHFLVQDVPGRSYILLHALNFFNDTEGCIGIGARFSRLNEDQQLDITSSRATLDKLYRDMPAELQLTLKEHDQFQTFYVTPKISMAINDVDYD